MKQIGEMTKYNANQRTCLLHSIQLGQSFYNDIYCITSDDSTSIMFGKEYPQAMDKYIIVVLPICMVCNWLT